MANVYQTASQTCQVKSDNYATTITSRLYEHLIKGSLADCLLSAEGKFIRAHKLILSISSEYFESMFSVSGLEKPVIIMPLGLKFNDLLLILDFAYLGQAQVPHESLDDFLKAGELLQIRGIKERRLNFMTTQQTTMNRSFDSTISSTQETFTPQPPTKRPRDDDEITQEITIQEASEIMKMLLESNPELEGEIQEKTQVNPMPLPTTNFLPRTSMMQAPQSTLFSRPMIPLTTAKKKSIPNHQSQGKEKFPCKFCQRALASKGRVTKHEKECNDNPNREIVVCDVCHMEIKPSAMTLHKRTKHGPPKQIISPDYSNQLPVISSSPSPRICSPPAMINIVQTSLSSPVDPLLTSPQMSPTGNIVTLVDASPVQLVKTEIIDFKKEDEAMKMIDISP